MGNIVQAPGRQYYLDWLRVFAILGVFLFHNARFFDAFSDWHVKNATLNLGATTFVAFMSQWMMPLFFLVAGAGTYYALKSRNPLSYTKERALRLLVPLIFGMLVIVVPQAYFEAVGHGVNLGGYNFFQIYGLYLQSLPQMNWFHLWFLVDLFLISLVTIPFIFAWRRGGQSLISRLASVVEKPWALLVLLVASITLANIFLYPDGFWAGQNGGWSLISYLLFFLFGYLIFANPRIMELVRKLRRISLATGLVTFAMALAYVSILGDPVQYFGSPLYAGTMLIKSLSVWGWLFAILGFGSFYLNRTNRFLSYGNEAVLPFYVLHQTVIIIIGFYVVQWDAGVGAKYLVISTTSFIGIMGLYEFLVRRIRVLRFLFGMKQIIRSSTAPVKAKIASPDSPYPARTRI